MAASFRHLLLAFFLIICCIINPRDSTKENALGGRYIQNGTIIGPRESVTLLKRGQSPNVVLSISAWLDFATSIINFITSVINALNTRICTSTIPSKKGVLTSSRCLENYPTVIFVAGNCHYVKKEDFDPPTQVRKMISYKTAPESVENNTLAYAFIDMDWVFGDYVLPISLYFDKEQLPDDWHDNCIVVGFGKASPVEDDSRIGRIMHQVVSSRLACHDTSPHSAFLCSVDTYNKTICEGDLGGPLLCHVGPNKLRQFGIVHGSMGKHRHMDLECMTPQLENRYLYLGFFRHFLEDLPKEELEYYPDGAPILRRKQEKKPASGAGGRGEVWHGHTGAISLTSQHLLLATPYLLLLPAF